MSATSRKVYDDVVRMIATTISTVTVDGKQVAFSDVVPVLPPVRGDHNQAHDTLHAAMRFWVDKATSSPRAWMLADHRILTARLLQQLSGDGPDRLLSWDVYAAILDFAEASATERRHIGWLWQQALRDRRAQRPNRTKGETSLEEALMKMQLQEPLTSEKAFMDMVRYRYKESGMTLRKCALAMQSASRKDAIAKSTLSEWLHSDRVPYNHAGLAVLLQVILPGPPTPTLIEHYITIAQHLRNAPPDTPPPDTPLLSAPAPEEAAPETIALLPEPDPLPGPDVIDTDIEPAPVGGQAPGRKPGHLLVLYTIIAASILLNIVLLCLLLL